MSKLKELFKKNTNPVREKNTAKDKKGPFVPDGMFVKCPKCQAAVYKEDVREHFYTCPKCGGYFRIKTGTRIRMVADPGSFREWFMEVEEKNALEFPGYAKKLEEVQKKTQLQEAVTIGEARINGLPVVLGVCDARFLMGSMGYVVGEKIASAFEMATEKKLPVVLFCCSGGARMQEGIVSLMQMAKTAAAIKRHSENGLFYLPVLTDPTTGGVTASFAMLGDIILAEPGTLIGFAGPRVIRETIGQTLPEGFQRAEFLLEKGFLDGIVERRDLKETLWKLLRIHQMGKELPQNVKTEQEEKVEPIELSEERTAWERVELSRSAGRPTTMEYIREIFTDFIELHGDRAFGDDGAVVGGLAFLDQIPVTVIGHQKGSSTKENIHRNFGMASPEGYRKALRLMKQAEKFGRPVITFVDTPGAACAMEAEERGQGEAIARNLFEMSDLRTPILSIVIGEGGSGGALGLAVADEVWMLENATYSILSPEGFASILWKDGKRAKEASELMKITAKDLYELGIVEQVILENGQAAEETLDAISTDLKRRIRNFLRKQDGKTKEELVGERYIRFRNL